MIRSILIADLQMIAEYKYRTEDNNNLMKEIAFC